MQQNAVATVVAGRLYLLLVDDMVSMFLIIVNTVGFTRNSHWLECLSSCVLHISTHMGAVWTSFACVWFPVLIWCRTAADRLSENLVQYCNISQSSDSLVSFGMKQSLPAITVRANSETAAELLSVLPWTYTCPSSFASATVYITWSRPDNLFAYIAPVLYRLRNSIWVTRNAYLVKKGSRITYPCRWTCSTW